MALTKEQKADQIKKLTVQLKDAESVMFSNYIGLNVADVSEFRNKLREGNAEMKVAKKTLIQRACKEAGLPEIPQDELTGPVACIFSFEDPLSGAQIAFKFAKKHDQVALVGGVYDGRVLTKEEAVELAKMPSRDQLLAKFVGMLQAPLNSFASICTSPLGGFARALDQMADKGGFVKDEAPAEAPAPAAEEKEEEAPLEAPQDKPAEEAAAPTEDPKPDAAPAAKEETES
jgi:large subunit ribosomal protein L10